MTVRNSGLVKLHLDSRRTPLKASHIDGSKLSQKVPHSMTRNSDERKGPPLRSRPILLLHSMTRNSDERKGSSLRSRPLLQQRLFLTPTLFQEVRGDGE
ncbi:13317_t:CDS:2 [Acaulospora colombiana]|uniref:13317_t:CDS:1 n=1 Tax=Acaulospora colombiana TaxID=27376 RepID=A0ACA9K641_9GLOM|nr:13317_t:CDS:2 [Acaulospora colombiana]